MEHRAKGLFLKQNINTHHTYRVHSMACDICGNYANTAVSVAIRSV